VSPPTLNGVHCLSGGENDQAAIVTLNVADLSAMVHELAGASGSLGLLEVSLASKSYGGATREGTDLQAAMALLMQELARAWESMRRYLDEQAPPQSKAG